MENFLQSVLEISVEWNKKKLILIFLIGLFQGQMKGQSKTDLSLSAKELAHFNELFFRAEKDLNLENYDKALAKYRALYKINPDNATVCFHLGKLYLRQQAQDDAIFYGERAVDLDSKNKWFKIGLAGIYRSFRISEKLVNVILQLLELEPENPDYNFELALAYLDNGEPKKAIKQLNHLEEIIGVHESVIDEKKRIYLALDDLEAATAELQKLIDAYPKELNYYGALGRLYMVNNKPEKAKEIYDKMLEVSPDDPRPHLDLAQFYRRSGQKSKSLHHLKIAIANPNLDIDQKIPTLLSLFGASENDSALKAEAYIMLGDIISTNPNDPKSYAIYGDFLSRDGRNIDALAAYKKAVKLDEGGKYQIWEQIMLIEIQTEMFDSLAIDGSKVIELFPIQPRAYLFTGIAQINIKKILDGIDFLEEGLNYVINDPRLKEQFYTQLADAHHRLENHKKSDAYFDKALELNPQNASALNNYSYYLSLREESLEKALVMTKKSNMISPENATFLDTWAWVLFQNQKYPEALSKMERVLQIIKIPNGEILEHYGEILIKNNKNSEAVIQFQKAKNLGHKPDLMEEKINLLSSP